MRIYREEPRIDSRNNANVFRINAVCICYRNIQTVQSVQDFLKYVSTSIVCFHWILKMSFWQIGYFIDILHLLLKNSA